MTQSLRAAAALALTVACSCGTIPERFPLPAGEWTGDLVAPGVLAAIGFLARVPPTGDSLAFTALPAMGFPGGEISALRLMRDSMEFRWTTQRVRECGLGRDSTGAWEGDCTRSGASAWRIRLLPPAMRQLPVGHARSLLARRDYRWETRAAPWGRLHVSLRSTGGGRPDASAIEAASQAISHALGTGAALLGTDRYDRPLDAFLVDGRADLDALTGRTDGSSADALGTTIILARFGSLPTVTRHEVMHVLSLNLWGVPAEPAAWAREGIATYAGGSCAGYPLHQVAASLVERGEMVSMRALLDDFLRQDDVVAYLASGSLFQFIAERRGHDVARDVWRRGLEPALHARGETLESLEAEWLTFLARVPGAGTVDWGRIRDADGCG